MTYQIYDNLSVNGNRVTAVGSPSTNTDAANKAYVDAVASGLDWKQSVVAASTGDVDITGPGATLDGVTLNTNDRILLWQQTAQEENGIYVFHGAASALTRATDADSAGDLTKGATVAVEEGTTNAQKNFVQLLQVTTLDTDPIQWTLSGSGGATNYSSGDGLTLSGDQFSVAAGTGIITSNGVTEIDTSVVDRKKTFTIGNGSANSFTLAHNLGTQFVQVEVIDLGSGETVGTSVTRPDANNVTVGFGGYTPTTNQFGVQVSG